MPLIQAIAITSQSETSRKCYLKVANESRFLLNINMLPNLPFTHAKHDF